MGSYSIRILVFCKARFFSKVDEVLLLFKAESALSFSFVIGIWIHVYPGAVGGKKEVAFPFISVFFDSFVSGLEDFLFPPPF